MNPSGINSSSGCFSPAPGAAQGYSNSMMLGPWNPWQMFNQMNTMGMPNQMPQMGPMAMTNSYPMHGQMQNFYMNQMTPGFQPPAASQPIPSPQMNPGSSNSDSQRSVSSGYMPPPPQPQLQHYQPNQMNSSEMLQNVQIPVNDRKRSALSDPTDVPASKRVHFSPLKVQNRCVLQQKTEYEVDKNEIERRIHGPEGMNATTLETYLRIPKGKKEIREFREKLGEHNLQIMSKKRKVTENTCFSALTEGEGRHFAKDYTDILKDVQMSKSIGALLVARCQFSREFFFYSQVFVSLLLRQFPSETIPNKESPFYNFFCMTHAFGVDALKSILEVVMQIFSDVCYCFDTTGMRLGVPMTGEMFAQQTAAFNNSNFCSNESEITPSEKFAEKVPARFTLPGMNDSYEVPYSEIKRRIEQPENINCSLLNLILRRGKKKSGGENLRKELKVRNLNLGPGKRGRPKTLFTALTEAEAQKMALNFKSLLEDYLDVTTLKNVARKQQSQLDQYLQHITFIFSHLKTIFDADRSELTNRISVPADGCPLKPEVNAAFNELSARTHGFGVFAFKFAIGRIHDCLQRSD
ncbi:hypothetical protein L596_028458 [Steinernema carpocapsae]|uniref:Transcription factor AP-2 C-terminal domain-containing protein n=1 Tax=Steinernema carpocapsae TaxID=34508 RepID=A0A4U5LYK5_STECR|nr:hypothetical protein L596_028458 [Steinernema carpocapsae]